MRRAQTRKLTFYAIFFEITSIQLFIFWAISSSALANNSVGVIFSVLANFLAEKKVSASNWETQLSDVY